MQFNVTYFAIIQLAFDAHLKGIQINGVQIEQNVWFDDGCNEMVIFSELYDFTISVLQFPS
jgi:hypothetical protein